MARHTPAEFTVKLERENRKYNESYVIKQTDVKLLTTDIAHSLQMFKIIIRM
jgi:hypothetical protein